MRGWAAVAAGAVLTGALAAGCGSTPARLRGHRVALPAAGSASGATGGTQDAEYSYRGPASAAWPSAQLEVEVVSAPGGTSVLRADGVAAGLECRYYGTNGPRFQLRAVTRLSAAQARRVAATMAAVPLSHPLGEVTGCPDDDGSAEVIALSYPSRGDVDLWVTLSGCTTVSNGFIWASTS